MQQDNPWRKQMVNRGANNTPIAPNVNSSPSASNANANSNTPSWVKSRQANPSPNSSSPGSYNKPNRPLTQTIVSEPKTNNNQSNNASQPSWAQPKTDNSNSLVSSSVGRSSPAQDKTPPWVKTQGNKQSAQDSPSVVVNTTNNNSSPSTAPWVKNNNSSTQGQSSQPPWAKSSPNSSLNKGQVSQPPWVKSSPNSSVNQGQPSQASQSSQPSWVKNNPGSSSPGSQPSWASRKQGQGVNQTAPWMKKDGQGQNAWKLKQVSEIQKQKKELEEAMQRQAQQQKQRKRLQKLKMQKQKEEKDITRQLQNMAREDQHSRIRQQEQKQKVLEQAKLKEEERLNEEEKLKEQARMKQEQEKQKQLIKQKQQNKQKEAHSPQVLQSIKNQASKQTSRSRKDKARKMRIQNFESSKISHISSIQGVENIESSLQKENYLSDNMFRRYVKLLSEQSGESDYRHKILLQKSILMIQMDLARECQAELTSLISLRKITSRKRKIVFSNNLQIQYALCQGRKTSAGIDFSMNEIHQMQLLYQQYQVLNKCVWSLLRKKINLHLRAPLMCLAEYKGITFLVQYVCEQLTDVIETDIGMFQEISSQVIMLERELQTQQGPTLTKERLMVKKIALGTDDFYVLYIKNQPKEKSNEVQKFKFDSKKFTDIKILQNLTSHSNLLPYYTPVPSLLKQKSDLLFKTCSQIQLNILSKVIVAEAIYTVYSSCQGQVNEESFFRLLLDGSQQLWQMIGQLGCSQKQASPLVLNYLQNYTDISFDHLPRIKKLVMECKPRVYVQRFDFQLVEFAKNLQKYIGQERQELVQESMHLNRALWQEIIKLQSNQFNFQQVKNQISYLLYKNMQSQAIELLQSCKTKLPASSIHLLPISLLFLKIYVANDQEVPLLKTLAELIELLGFYFGEQTTIHAHVYAVVGSYYSRKSSQYKDKVMTFYEHALSIALKIHGEKALQVAQIYLSRANASVSLQILPLFHKDIVLALKIYKSHSKRGIRVAECMYLQGKVACLQGKKGEGVSLMHASAQLLLKMQNHVQALCILFQLFTFLANDQAKYEVVVEQIVSVCFNYKSVWAFKKINTLILDRQLNCYTTVGITQLQQLFSQESSLTSQEIMIDLQQQIKGFSSFVQIVRWSVSIVAARMSTKREFSNQYEKACRIVQGVIHFYAKEQPEMSFDVRDSQIL